MGGGGVRKSIREQKYFFITSSLNIYKLPFHGVYIVLGIVKYLDLSIQGDIPGLFAVLCHFM